jgi:hypothetical protein
MVWATCWVIFKIAKSSGHPECKLLFRIKFRSSVQIFNLNLSLRRGQEKTEMGFFSRRLGIMKKKENVHSTRFSLLRLFCNKKMEDFKIGST